MPQDRENDVGSIETVNSSERTPLLQGGPDGSVDSAIQFPPSVFRRVGIIATCICLIILIELGAYLATIPLNEVLEEIICHKYLPGLSPKPNDTRCKDNAIQSELSLIRGWQSTLDFVPGLLTALPYGFLADRHGRELVLGLSLLGMTLASGFYIIVCAYPSIFPPRLTWASFAFTFIGGGPAVFNAMIFTIVGDVTSEELRATTFSYLGAAVICGELIASPLVYFLMQVNLWLPIFCGLGCLFLATGMSFFLPETLDQDKQLAQEATCPETSLQGRVSAWVQATRLQLVTLMKATAWFILGSKLVTALLFTFLVTTIGRFAQEILLQYVTKRYGWTWSQASLLLFVRASASLVLLTLLLPFAGYIFVQRWGFSTQEKDMWFARLSSSLLAVGSFLIGLSGIPGLMIVGLGLSALGTGYNFLIRSLLASVVEKHHMGMMYMTIGIFETAGALMAGPLLAASFRKGMDLGGAWIGLPYIVAGCLFTIAGITVHSIRLSRLETHKTPESQEPDENSLLSD